MSADSPIAAACRLQLMCLRSLVSCSNRVVRVARLLSSAHARVGAGHAFLAPRPVSLSDLHLLLLTGRSRYDLRHPAVS